MKQLLTIALILGILIQSLGKLVLLSNYLLNKEYITLNFCENKNKPKLRCNGKCHLAKQLKKQEKQDNSAKNTTRASDQVQFCSDYVSTVSPQLLHLSISLNWGYLLTETEKTPVSVFHPPTV